MKIVKTYQDENCPKCDFPETVIIREAETMKPLIMECSSQKCNWARKLKEGIDFSKKKGGKNG